MSDYPRLLLYFRFHVTVKQFYVEHDLQETVIGLASQGRYVYLVRLSGSENGGIDHQNNLTHLSVALPVDVDGRRGHYSRYFHVSCMRDVFENSVAVPDIGKEKNKTRQNCGRLFPSSSQTCPHCSGSGRIGGNVWRRSLSCPRLSSGRTHSWSDSTSCTVSRA